ncbi:hypothetical protein Rleg4DRAFT_6749 [Rhizobium leguminosarum bv. trifolii WSM2297]|uniref:Uncharacterized protein n=1 Tax=Rhizobium leguminosarum bv. trifolii WSM2297 TaxID=754762 RepID=J0WHI5_RHILT|nr:hypothetical protein [Rhizobium leguminosarum]EJC83505.1 hypothetical protein Rleg4DRAFT_5272 [Rhizobium leguminosarum bv. trifolii WSM2297]EJC84903.1 hypothetical protein Rleg4DRAFT_6749 [Rhizobium leguminosarum bv. trifolii WSM2297]
MEEMTSIIKDLSIEEREEIFVDIARTLEDTAREALVEGDMHFAELSNNLAEALRFNADELARDDLENAERVLLQATAMVSQFEAVHPYRMMSMAVH